MTGHEGRPASAGMSVWPLRATAAVGAVALVSSVGTLAAALRPVIGDAWAWPVAVLVDTLALCLAWWVAAAARAGLPVTGPRVGAHVCVLVSVVLQVGTAVQGLGDGAGGWTSAVLHAVAPLVLGAVLELVVRHHAAEHRAALAPVRARETLRVQVARAAAGLPVDQRACALAVVEAARADQVDVRVLAASIPVDAVRESRALTALAAVVGPVEPVVTVGPVGPVGPVEAVDPRAPAGSGRVAVVAAGPVEDSGPVEPVGPVEDAGPVESRAPSGRTGRARQSADPSDLLMVGQAVARELTRTGQRVTRDALRDGVRARGHTCSTDRAQALLVALRDRESA